MMAHSLLFGDGKNLFPCQEVFLEIYLVGSSTDDVQPNRTHTHTQADALSIPEPTTLGRSGNERKLRSNPSPSDNKLKANCC